MTKKDFFILIIKLFGLYSIILPLFKLLPNNIIFIISDAKSVPMIHWISTFAILSITITLFILLIFKSHHIVRLLRLDKGFDDDKLELGHLTSSEIVKIAIVIIGGFLIIDNLSIFIHELIDAFYADNQYGWARSGNNSNLFIAGLNILIGLLLITRLNLIIKLLKIKTKKE